MSKKLETNEDFILDIMNNSKYGGLCQVMIMQSIQEYTKFVMASKEELLKEDAEKKAKQLEEGSISISIVNIHSWVGVAEDINKRINDFQNRNS